MEKLPESIQQEIGELDNLDGRKLRRKYGVMLADVDACKSSGLLRQIVAYRLQERFYGISLSSEATEWLSKGCDDLGADGKGPSQARFVRVWKGVSHEVFVLENGRYEHNGTVYKSLSAVARAITGTNWNGKLVFGVK